MSQEQYSSNWNEVRADQLATLLRWRGGGAAPVIELCHPTTDGPTCPYLRCYTRHRLDNVYTCCYRKSLHGLLRKEVPFCSGPPDFKTVERSDLLQVQE